MSPDVTRYSLGTKQSIVDNYKSKGIHLAKPGEYQYDIPQRGPVEKDILERVQKEKALQEGIIYFYNNTMHYKYTKNTHTYTHHKYSKYLSFLWAWWLKREKSIEPFCLQLHVSS